MQTVINFHFRLTKTEKKLNLTISAIQHKKLPVVHCKVIVDCTLGLRTNETIHLDFSEPVCCGGNPASYEFKNDFQK